jgi:CheY-like chemotaxis protein
MTDERSSNTDSSTPDTGGQPFEARSTGPRPKILCIEGHSSLRDVTAQLLGLGSDYEVEMAQNGLEGVQKARTWQPDLILTGLRLAVMDGYEAIKIIRGNPVIADTPIIVVSAWSDAKSKQRALEAGANEHITPHIDVERLIRRINWYLDQKRQGE